MNSYQLYLDALEPEKFPSLPPDEVEDDDDEYEDGDEEDDEIEDVEDDPEKKE